ncbi:MAG: hypothetical protein H8E98_05740 [Bacteroidetes bacterium]|nr:hypothetical protein [Bacteroidota bacterium]
MNEGILAEGLPYIVELNTGTSFENVIYSGMKYMNGKQLLVFHTKDNRQLSVNPSFHTFTLEQILEETENKQTTTNKKENKDGKTIE